MALPGGRCPEKAEKIRAQERHFLRARYRLATPSAWTLPFGNVQRSGEAEPLELLPEGLAADPEEASGLGSMALGEIEY